MKRGTLRESGADRGQSIDYLAARTKRPWIVAGPGPLGVPDVRGREVYGSLRLIGGGAIGAPVAPGDQIVLSVPATSTVLGRRQRIRPKHDGCVCVWRWFAVEPQRRILVGHQRCVGGDTEHQAVHAHEEVENPAGVAAGE